MKNQLERDKPLVDYLLGKLSPEAELRFAEQYFIDDKLFDRLKHVENELLDLYARGRLDPEERASFEHYLAIHPEGRSKVALARGLKKLSTSERVNSESVLDEEAPLSWWGSFLTSQKHQNTVLRWAVAACILITVLSVTYIVHQHRRVSEAQNDLKALRNTEEALRQKIAEQEAVIAKSKETEQHRQTNPQLNEAEVAQHPSVMESPPRQIPDRIAYLLFTLPLRGAGKAETLDLAPNTKSVSVTIILDNSETYSRYSVKVESANGNSVMQRYLAPKTVRSRRILEFTISDQKRLTESDYKINVTAVDEAGREMTNAARTVSFKIGRKQP